MKLGDLLTLAYIGASISGIYDAWWRRRRDRENDQKDIRIGDLERRLARLEKEKGAAK
jgi:hypothetical protein